MDTRDDAILKICFAWILNETCAAAQEVAALLGNNIPPSLRLDFDELIFPNLKPITISLEIDGDYKMVRVNPPGRRVKRVEEELRKKSGTFCREYRATYCAVKNCAKQTNWMSEIYGTRPEGEEFTSLVFANGEEAARVALCPKHAQALSLAMNYLARPIQVVDSRGLWQAVSDYLTGLYLSQKKTRLQLPPKNESGSLDDRRDEEYPELEDD
jgi:hypothetical protein